LPEIRLQPRASNERPVCVCCRGELGSNDAALACTECSVPLHWECWRSLERCPTSGCTGKAKHSDRLTAELSEWGPVAPQIRGAPDAPEEREPEPRQRPPHLAEAPDEAKGQPGPTAAPEGLGEAGKPGPTAASEGRSRLPEVDEGVTHDASYLTLHGMLWGAIAGSVTGLIVATFSDRHLTYGRATLGLFAGAVFGAGAGCGLGYLQSLVGLRHPQPEGLGMLSLFNTLIAGLVGYGLAGWVGAALLGVPVWLACGRFLGFHPGESRRR